MQEISRRQTKFVEDVAAGLAAYRHMSDQTVRANAMIRQVVDDHAAAFETVRRFNAAVAEMTAPVRAAIELMSVSTLTVGRVTRVVETTVQAPGTTTSDLLAVAVELCTALRETEERRVAALAAARAPTSYPILNSPWWAVAGTLAGVVQMLLALLAIVLTATATAQPVSAPTAPVVAPQPDPAEIDRRVDERVREIEKQHHADQPRPPEQRSRTAEGPDVSP